LASGIHETMLSSLPDDVGDEPVMRIFNDWPMSWDAAFSLLAGGGFVVGSSMEKGQIEFVQIQSKVGGECRLHNPWPDKAVTLYRNGSKAEDIAGSLLKFPTTVGETINIVLKGTKPSRKEIL
jgi:hypothetical protein